LGFTALSSPASSLVQLRLSNLNAQLDDGSPVINRFGASGRVFVFSREPLLAVTNQAGAVALLLFGRVGATYVIECATNLNPIINWTPITTALQTNDVELVPLLSAQPKAFYRAREASEPILEIESLGGAVFRLTLRGQPGNRYTVQTATRISSPVPWSDLFHLTLTNSSAVLNWTNSTENRRFFRASQP
jgi:hypothetical protein